MDNKDTETTEVDKEVDAENTETESEETEKEESDKDKETEAEHLDDIDYDAEIEKERQAGKPNSEKAKEAFLKREAKRKQDLQDEEEDDKPLTRKDLAAVEARAYARAQAERVQDLAKGLTASDKEATLLVERWKNRSFPEGIPLSEQIEEVFAGMHRKKLIGERNEALRGLKNKAMVNRDGSSAHREGSKPLKPKMKAADEAGILAAGYALNTSTNMYEKKFPNGSKLVYDPKTNQSLHIPKGKS